MKITASRQRGGNKLLVDNTRYTFATSKTETTEDCHITIAEDDEDFDNPKRLYMIVCDKKESMNLASSIAQWIVAELKENSSWQTKRKTNAQALRELADRIEEQER